MNEKFEVRTETGGKEFMKFNRFHLFRRSWFVAYLPSIIFVLLGAAAFYDDDRPAAISMWVLALLMPFILIGITWVASKMHLRTNKMYANMKNIFYTFDRGGLFNETVSPKLKTTLQTDWDSVYRVYESKDSFYIYVSNMQAFIIPKAHITKGTPDGLAMMMEELVGKKYYKR